MRKIYVIGTTHDMLPKHTQEFKSLLEKYNPDMVLVEIVQADINKNKIKNRYPREMIYALKWAIKNDKAAKGFDVRYKMVKTPSKEVKRAIKEFERKYTYLKKLDWKDFNNIENLIVGDDMFNSIIDTKAELRRERSMLKNIKKYLKNAIFPLMK